MDARRRGLGRGLGALIPEVTHAPPRPEPESTAWAALASISPNPLQPRDVFDETALDELAASIREKGLLQPLVVRRTKDGNYQLIAGERRFRAAQRAGLTRVPVVVRVADDGEALELALIENLQRENLNPVEEARAFQRLADEFGLAQEQIAHRVGKSRSAVTNSMRLLHLPSDVLAQLESGALSAGHARSLLGLTSAQAQAAVAKDVIAQHLSVRDTEKLVRERAPAPSGDVEQRAVEAELARVLGTRVHLRHKKDGSGRLIIEYYSLDGLDGIIARLGARSGAPNQF
jgi:ParB family transcriptional regulator, chromosome partitioning protein